MPLNESGSKEAFDENIATLIGEGKDREQAIAIARDIMEKFKKDRAGRLTPLEKAALFGLVEMNDRELESALSSVNKEKESKSRKGQDYQKEDAFVGEIHNERSKRLSRGGVSKGFITGDPEGGMHAHGLSRKSGRTFADGNHMHLWVLPGTKQIVVSAQDGSHQHAVDGDSTSVDGQHSHDVRLPGGEVVGTSLSGAHSHELMLESTGFGGLHKHSLRLQDGTEIESLSPSEFAETFGIDATSFPLERASDISGALLEIQRLRMEIIARDFDNGVLSVDEAIELMKAGNDSDFRVALEVSAVKGDRVELSDGISMPISKFPEGIKSGDMVEISNNGEISYAKSVVPHSKEDIAKILRAHEQIKRAGEKIGFTGSEDSQVMFIAGWPNELEAARKEALVGDDGEAFNELYLEPLGLTRKDVSIGFAVPFVTEGEPSEKDFSRYAEDLIDAMKSNPKACIVSLGKPAHEFLKAGGIESVYLPHPCAVRKSGSTDLVRRKMKQVAKSLDVNPHNVDKFFLRPSNGRAEHLGVDAKTVSIVKSEDEKQIVSAVVLDPYKIDAHNDWIPPAEVEATAFGFMEKSRIIGVEHRKRADAVIVGSHVFDYPDGERIKAMNNEPHKVHEFPFGNDVVHSGTWVLTVRLSDELWSSYKSGELNAFSIGGRSLKSRVDRAAMPAVEIVKVGESPSL